MGTRISKFLSDAGVASRRTAEQMIAHGAVSVNNTVINSPVVFVDENDVVMVNGERVLPRNETRIFVFHKPINTMTTTSDPQGRKTIYDCLPLKYRHLKYIGRLDYRTTGLLLMTNDGELARKLTLPDANIPRVYIANVGGDNLSGLDKARTGITIDGTKYKPMQIDVISKNSAGTQIRVEISEGKKNEIRIVMRACGCPVRKLHRVQFGNIKLGNLPVGKIKELNQKTIDAIKKSL